VAAPNDHLTGGGPSDAVPDGAEDWRDYERQFRTAFTNYGSFEEFQQAIQKFRAQLTPAQLQLVRDWIEIGQGNPWISEANDPPFNELSFHICQDIRELADRLLHGNWCLGQAFSLDNICFINQVDGGDEWLTIRDRVSFESITMQTFDESREQAEARLFRTIERIRRATEEQLRQLEY
jgi:hypothetical protein